jgi:hypothetical protein
MADIAEELARADLAFYEVEGHWPDRPRLDPNLRARVREVAEALLAERD